MSEALNTFFEACSVTDAAEQSTKIAASCSPDVTYSDPRSDARLDGQTAMSDYVDMFSANAPGWTTHVVSSDDTSGFARSIIAFGGRGPDGYEIVQHGTYFSDSEHGKLTMMPGFVGTGAVE
jgi:hypothetical protein